MEEQAILGRNEEQSIQIMKNAINKIERGSIYVVDVLYSNSINSVDGFTILYRSKDTYSHSELMDKLKGK